MDDGEAALEFHRLTRHGSPVDRSGLVDFYPLDPENRPAPFKRYPGLDTDPLPRDFGTTGVPAVDVLSGRRPPETMRLDENVLSRMLFFAAGVTRVSDSPAFGERTYFRAAMSAGNLHPVELYVVCGDIGGVPGGVYHYAPLEHGLTRLRSDAAGEGCAIVLSGIPWRTAWKYGERGYRHLYWDAGTMVANLLAVAEAHGLTAGVEVGFEDEAVSRLVGVDGRSELPLAVVAIGDRGVALAGPPDALSLDVEPISPRPVDFPLVGATHAAGVLSSAGAWQAAAATLGSPAADRVEPPALDESPSIEEVILHRGSTRIMRPEIAPRPLLDWGMAVAARPVPGDFTASGATLLEHDLSVHGIEGVEPGAYRWRGAALEPVHLGDLREAARLLCLRQPLGGDSAYTAFHCADLAAVLGALGSRGYRAAQLEAGIAAGRLTLAAFALGYGATGLTFYDEAVSRFFDTSASCMLVTSVGVPGYHNTPGGLPGAATALTGYPRLMQRLSLQLQRG